MYNFELKKENKLHRLPDMIQIIKYHTVMRGIRLMYTRMYKETSKHNTYSYRKRHCAGVYSTWLNVLYRFFSSIFIFTFIFISG